MKIGASLVLNVNEQDQNTGEKFSSFTSKYCCIIGVSFASDMGAANLPTETGEYTEIFFAARAAA